MSAETFEVYAGVVRRDEPPYASFDDRRRAENVADSMAMRGQPASVYEVSGHDARRVYAVSL